MDRTGRELGDRKATPGVLTAATPADASQEVELAAPGASVRQREEAAAKSKAADAAKGETGAAEEKAARRQVSVGEQDSVATTEQRCISKTAPVGI